MSKSQDVSQNKIRILHWKEKVPVTPEEAEARLHQEGYQTFCWYDVAGTEYPKHRHDYDECLWILKGEMEFRSGDEAYTLKSGDRVYLAAFTYHTVKVPHQGGVTFLVGQIRETVRK